MSHPLVTAICKNITEVPGLKSVGLSSPRVSDDWGVPVRTRNFRSSAFKIDTFETLALQLPYHSARFFLYKPIHKIFRIAL